MANESPPVKATGLTKRFGETTVVDDVDFTIPEGRCFGILGPNGAGKTTIIRMILGLSPPSGGTLEVFGAPMPAEGRALRQRIGVVPQIDNLDPDFTVVENLRMYGAYFGFSPSELATRIGELLDFVSLEDRADANIGALSGGMKRRLTIARALINDPDLVVLDEPTTGLDPQVRHLIWARLRQLLARGKTLLLTTHYMEEAERLCDDLVIMEIGRIIESGAPAALVERHVPGEVIEVRNAPADLEAQFAACGDFQVELIGETLYGYGRDPRAMIDLLETRPGLAFVRRPANLEDVFLRLTGRDLQE